MSSREPRTLLIVEDDDQTFSALKGLFIVRRWPDGTRRWRVSRAASSPEAVAALVEALPHAVLLDLWLPGGHGEDVLRAAADLSNPPRIVVVTGDPTAARHAAALALGAVAVMMKPVDITEVYRAVEGPEEVRP